MANICARCVCARDCCYCKKDENIFTLRQWVSEYEISSGSSIRCKSALFNALDEESKRLDIVTGVRSMCQVTCRCNIPCHVALQQKKYNAEVLSKCISLNSHVCAKKVSGQCGRS